MRRAMMAGGSLAMALRVARAAEPAAPGDFWEPTFWNADFWAVGFWTVA